MKKIFFLHILLLIFLVSHSQVPQALNYQAIARTSNGVLIPSQNIGVRFSILEGTITGTPVYTETHQTTTNSFGLFTLEIGHGTPTTGTFATINWGSGTAKFLKVEIAPTGGTTYQLQGTTQLLSVPYALFAAKTNLIAGNNTIVITNGNTIAGNYQAGPGINISGNVISSTAGSLWVPDVNGIHNLSGNVGIRVNSHPIYPLDVYQPNTGIGNGVARFQSDDVWHASIAIKNNPANYQYAFMVGGPTNIELKPNNFAISNTNLSTTTRISLTIDGVTNNIGIGYNNTIYPAGGARSTLHVFRGDVNIEEIGSGIILKSPNGQCWRVTIDNSGNLIRTAISCP